MSETVARVLDVGNCDPDHAAIRGMLERSFAVTVDRVMHVDEALAAMRRARYDLVLVNRLIFADRSPGIDLIHRARSDAALADVPIMLVSNHADVRAAAVAAGGVEGFGKASIGSRETIERLARHLPRAAGAPQR